jgi:CBS domain containing-hemolysin-like protein
MLSSKERINDDIKLKIKTKGFSGVPIFEGNKNNVVGILKSKILLDDKYNQASLASFKSNSPLIVSKDTSLFEMLMIFQDKGRSLALINDENKKTQLVSNKGDEIYYSVRTIIIFVFM